MHQGMQFREPHTGVALVLWVRRIQRTKLNELNYIVQIRAGRQLPQRTHQSDPKVSHISEHQERKDLSLDLRETAF